MPGGRAIAYYNENNVRGTYFEHPDALGTVTEWTDSSGNVAIGNQKFYPWGEAWGGQVAWFGDPNFAGMEHRNAEGFDVTPNRQYNPAIGRGMTPDPQNAGAKVNQPQTWDEYSYVANNPTTNADPTGLACVKGDDGSYFDDTSGGQSCAQVDAPIYSNLRP